MKNAPKHFVVVLLSAILAIASALAIIALFLMRFHAGDVYPHHSTLRADPLGTRVLFESIRESGLATVSRNTRHIQDINLTSDTTLFFLGDQYPISDAEETLPKDLANDLFHFVHDGGRLVVTLHPFFRIGSEEDANDTNTTAKVETEDRDSPCESCKKCDSGHAEATPDTDSPVINVTAWFGTEAFARPDATPGMTATQTMAYAHSGLPETLPANTSLCFTNLASAWHVVYANHGQPVVMERPVGKGSMVLSTLSYVVSNEALRDDPYPQFLTWLMDNHARAIFDEVHLGITESPGVASLLRRYRLFGVLAACIGVALLWVWQQALPLVPPRPTVTSNAIDSSTERDSMAGYVNLLRRSIPQRKILPVCVDAWRESLAHTPLNDPQLQNHIDDLLADTDDNPVNVYNTIANTIDKRSK